METDVFFTHLVLAPINTYTWYHKNAIRVIYLVRNFNLCTTDGVRWPGWIIGGLAPLTHPTLLAMGCGDSYGEH